MQDNFGSGWVVPASSHSKKKNWKIVPKQSYTSIGMGGGVEYCITMCILFVFTLLKVVSHYDLGVVFV